MDDHMAFFANGVLKIRRTIGKSTDDGAWTQIADALDRAKWALSVALKGDFSVGESPVVVRSTEGDRCPTLRRGSGAMGSGGKLIDCPLSELTARASSILREFRIATASSEGFARALWLLGRAYNAGLSRDAVLDATVGLESLLVAGPGESTYRVALHGSALVFEENEQVYKDLRRIYGLRSKAAHGVGSEETAFKEWAPRARYLLAQVMYSLVELANSKAIDLPGAEGNLPKAIQTWVVKILVEHGRPKGTPEEFRQ